MNIPFMGKGEYSIHDLVVALQSESILAGVDPTSFAVTGGIIGKMILSGAYRMHCEVHKAGNQVYKAWTLRRQGENIMDLMPDTRCWASHASGMMVMDSVQFVRDERMFDFAIKVATMMGRKTYEVVHNDRKVIVNEPIFLMEYLAKWQIENMAKLTKGEAVQFWHSPDLRGGRFYAYNRDGKVLPTMLDGDVCALWQLAEPNKVSKEDCDMWERMIAADAKVGIDVVQRTGKDEDFALGLFVNPIGGLRGVGLKKRNILRFVQNCQQLEEARKTGLSFGHIGKDAHAQGPVATSLAAGGTRACRDVMAGKKVYAGITPFIEGDFPEEVKPFVQSQDWGKNVLTVTNYTGRQLGAVFLYGMGGQLEDNEGNVLAPFSLKEAVLRAEDFRPELCLIKDWPQSDIKLLAKRVSDASVAAVQKWDPALFHLGDVWLAHMKARYANGETFAYQYDGVKFNHYKAVPALDWFPADPVTQKRDLPTISISLPHSCLELCKERGWPTRFQPRMAPFITGHRDETGQPVLPYEPTGVVNREDTPNGSLVAVTTCQDARTLTDTINDMESKSKGCVVSTRHDAITVRIGPWMRELAGVYARNMYRQCVGNYRTAMQEELGNLFPKIKNDVTEAEFVAAADHIFR